ncbi:hypothetical protein PPROV_000280300 [Pycnococcus provasolii]|uniref:Nucleoside phosphorylase domain-containing protein n=1 Tax=Pycnococcus provasolii TaxID=41880 RepID=A0A830HFD6_9CHLO|nr:hypothetical protein PPROV_000280300 [Pycnococcus provasolii]
MPVSSVLIVIAMEAEAAPIVEHLRLTPSDKMPSPFKAFAGTFQGALNVTIVCPGPCPIHGVDAVGTEAASLATYIGVQTYEPGVVINAGTCGGFQKRGAAIGDVYLVDEFRRHDRRIPIPAFASYADGSMEASTQTALLVDALKESWDVEKGPEAKGAVKQGLLTTGNSFANTDRCVEVMESFGAHVKDMEGQAVAWTCHITHTKLIGIKSVTDIVDREEGTAPGESEFLENLSAAARSLKTALVIVLKVLQARELDHV